jgi:hypothetical protein
VPNPHQGEQARNDGDGSWSLLKNGRVWYFDLSERMARLAAELENQNARELAAQGKRWHEWKGNPNED